MARIHALCALKLPLAAADEFGVMSLSSDETRPGVLQLPAAGPYGIKRSIECDIQEMQGKRLLLHSPEQIAESTLVSVEVEDTLLLGEVVVCAASADKWKIEMRVEQILTGLQSLMALRASLMNESYAAPLPLIPAGIRN